jgi:hypothetical protein
MKRDAAPGLMVYRLWMMSREQGAVGRYGSSSSTRSRFRFAARIVLETGLVYNLTFIVFTALQFVPAQLTANICQMAGQSVRSTLVLPDIDL